MHFLSSGILDTLVTVESARGSYAFDADRFSPFFFFPLFGITSRVSEILDA